MGRCVPLEPPVLAVATMSDFSRQTHPILNQAGRDWLYGLGKRKSHFPSKEETP
jgi:hypothetical protein